MIDHPYAPFLTELERPGRYLGGEFGAAPVPAEARLRIALAFPDSYELGMSHIGLAVLYEIANQLDGICCERVFMPWPDRERRLVERGLPLVSLESARPLAEFDLLGFSLQYELNATNLLAMLALGGVPVRAAERGERAPVVIAGGPVATHCEPLSPFLDLVVVGDGEEALPRLALEAARLKEEGRGRREIIEHLHRLPFAFAPSLLERTRDPVSGRTVVAPEQQPAARLARVKSLADHPPGRGPVPAVAAIFDRYSLEVARGCAAGCRFCQAGFLYRPVRERDEGSALAAARRAVDELGFDAVSLAALSTADHSRVGPLIETLGTDLTPKHVSLSVPSLRAYGLPDTLLEILGRFRATGVTLAPEAGSQRMRDVVNKNVTEEDLLAAAGRFFERGFARMKLYFMLGLPGEEDDDLDAIVELADRLRALGRRLLRGRQPSVTISISTFVPKPFTPFEREGMVSPAEIRRRQERVRGLARKKKLDVRVHDPRLTVLEGLISRGDAELASVIERAFEAGARFDGWDEHYDEALWNELLDDLDVADLTGPIPDDGRLPWDHVDTGVKSKHLRAERDRAREAATTGACGRFVATDGGSPRVVCNACGLACPPSNLPLADPRWRGVALPGGSPPVVAGRPRPWAASQPETEGAARYRIHFAAVDRQIYLGHLDRVRHLTASLRRAGLTVAYTRGFHPKPKMVSAPPLPLGMAGLAEPFDVFLVRPPGPEEILERLGRAAPAGLEFVAVEELPPGAKSLGKVIEGAEYGALITADRARVAAGIERLLEAEEHVVVRARKGRPREVEIRPFLVDAELVDAQPEDWRLPRAVGRTPLRFELAIPGSGGARPAEILEAVLGAAPKDPWIVRLRFLTA
jgi:radical SAM family uncharacterized protein/radical SAM-linked protein